MFHNVLGLWDGLDECEISRPEILSQSAPEHTQASVLTISDMLYVYVHKSLN